MRWRWVFAILLAAGTHAYGPIRWMKFPAERRVLTPKGFTRGSKALVPPQMLTITKSHDSILPNMFPHFTALYDKTIVLDDLGWCIEAGGHDGSDTVFVNHCTRKPAQKWDWIEVGHGRKMIQLQNTNKCLAVNDERDAWNTASIELRECGTKAAEAWAFDEAFPLPAQGHSRRVGHSSSMQHSIIYMTLFGLLSLSAWLWRWHTKSRMAAKGQSKAPTNNNQSGALRSASFSSQGCLPLSAGSNVSVQRMDPVVMALSPKTADSKRTPDPEMGEGSGEKANGGLGLLNWIPSQQLLVVTARFAWETVWRIMVSELAPQSDDGAFVRPSPQIGSGATWPADLPMVKGRYHVYVGNACPWCHRVSITMALRKQKQAGVLTMTQLGDDPGRASRGGWYFESSNPDPLCGAKDLKGVYDALYPEGYTGRCTAPLLVDLKTKKIISNESADITRMLNDFNVSDMVTTNDVGNLVDLFPDDKAQQIDEVNQWVYEMVNNGVYRAGFATKQRAYEAAERDVHEGLARCDKLLSTQRFLCGSTVTEADVRLLPTAVRFDGVYASFFRCGRKQIRSDYPNVERWMKEMLALDPSLLDTFDLDDARASYYRSLFPLNPGGIVPAGPTAEDLGFFDGNADVTNAFTWRSL